MPSITQPPASIQIPPATSGIYSITNTVNGKQYVGSAVHLRKRYNLHFSTLRRGTHVNRHLQASFNRYGEIAFTFTVLEHCSRDVLLEREQYWIDTLQTTDHAGGYNIAPCAGSVLGARWALNPAQRLHIAAGLQKQWADPAIRARRLESMRRTAGSAEFRQHKQIELAARFADPLERLRHGQRMRDELAADPTIIERGNETRRKLLETTDLRARYSVVQQEIQNRPDVRARKAAATRQRYSDPTKRQETAEQMRALWADPEYRRKRQEAAAQKKAANMPIDR